MDASANRNIQCSILLLAGLVIFFTAPASWGQSVWLVKDIRPGIGSGMPQIAWPTLVNGTLFFQATDGISGEELWKSDGTVSGTALVKDIAPGSIGSLPEELTELNGTLFFVASDTNGYELWKSDGTATGTALVKNIHPDQGGTYRPYDLTDFKGTLFFAANDGNFGLEPWKSDGTAAGTVMVKDINPGASGSFPQDFTLVNNELFFRVGVGSRGSVEWRELWKTDGTADGTVFLRTCYPRYLTDVDGTLFFRGFQETEGYELWKSDGTAAGTVMVKDINPGPNNSNPYDLTNVNGTLFFTADDGSAGHELWKSDGTAAGTVMVKDINASGSSIPDSYRTFSNVNGILYFQATDGISGEELWKSDGTSSGTVLIKDINPGPAQSFPRDFTYVNGTVFFAALEANTGWELWQTDGTATGTVLVEDLNPGSTGAFPPGNLIRINNNLFFSADNGLTSRELWTTQPLISVILNPVNPPIQIPPTGGSFQAEVSIKNHSGAPQNFEFWTEVLLANGSTTDPLFGPVTLDLSPGQEVTTTLTQSVPPVDPASFTYVGNAGSFPSSVIVSDSFTFTVTSGPKSLVDMQTGTTDGWQVTGGFGEQETVLTTLVPEEYTLEQNYPNPFNPTTTISYQLPQAGRVKIMIYDLTGREVTQLVNKFQNAGSHQIQWDGTNDHHQKVASGLYLYRIRAGEFVQTRKMALIK